MQMMTFERSASYRTEAAQLLSLFSLTAEEIGMLNAHKNCIPSIIPMRVGAYERAQLLDTFALSKSESDLVASMSGAKN